MTRLTVPFLCAFLAIASPVAAQEISRDCTSTYAHMERIGERHIRLLGSPVEIECPSMKFYAERVDYFTDTGRLEAAGNVVFTSPENQIGAERAEFDTKTRTGVFHEASGSASLGDRVDRSLFGTQEPDAYFYGQVIEKLGPRTYRVVRGGFTTCVQPTPRWEFTSTSVTLTLDEHAVLWNAVLKVKDVPLFYLPVLYYPLEKDDRSTGFLIPTYGSSTYKGQMLSNAFFWALGRSQDATFFHDWYSRTGQGFGSEYRYVSDPASSGNVRIYSLREHEAVIEQTGGGTTTLPARRSLEITAGASQALPWRLRAQGSVNYFSDLTILPAYHNNIYDASRRQRAYTGIVSGNWGSYSLSGAYQVTEYFYNENASTKYGGAPRISMSQSQRQIGQLPLFFGLGGQYERRLYETRDASAIKEQNLTKVDASASLRAPFNKLAFLTWDSSVGWPLTYYSESLDERGQQTAVPVTRTFLDLRSEITGPVFVRIFNTPSSGYAERFKHVIEPSVEFRYLTDIANADKIVRLGDPSDYLIGNNAQTRFRLTTRLLARRRQAQGVSVPREILTAGVQRTYYTDETASQFDPGYTSSFRGRKPSHWSPMSLTVSGAPTDVVTASLRVEYDPELPGLQSFGLGGAGTIGWVRASGGWSRRRVFGRTDLDNFLTADTTVRSLGGRVGGTYTLNYDFYRDSLVQQRIVGFYNAQCCGIVVEYQTFQFAYVDPRYGVPKDRRFNISFTLAGIGTFSNFFGVFGGQTGSR